jgi:hypothetical protein
MAYLGSIVFNKDCTHKHLEYTDNVNIRNLENILPVKREEQT